MKKLSFLYLLCMVLVLISCSHTTKKETLSIAPVSIGLLKSNIAPFPIYLMNTLEENRADLEQKYSKDIFIIHTGHLLKPNLSKEENEKQLTSLNDKGVDLVNLTLEDLAIADSQGINLEGYPQTFINSSIIDLNQDALYSRKNIVPYLIKNGITFIGLSDPQIDPSLPKEKFIINDYVLSILKIKKIVQKNTANTLTNSFIIVHDLGREIEDVMSRLPPSFVNSLAN